MGHLYLNPVRRETVHRIDSFGGEKETRRASKQILTEKKTNLNQEPFSEGAESACKIITVTVCVLRLWAGMEILPRTEWENMLCVSC